MHCRSDISGGLPLGLVAQHNGLHTVTCNIGFHGETGDIVKSFKCIGSTSADDRELGT